MGGGEILILYREKRACQVPFKKKGASREVYCKEKKGERLWEKGARLFLMGNRRCKTGPIKRVIP